MSFTHSLFGSFKLLIHNFNKFLIKRTAKFLSKNSQQIRKNLHMLLASHLLYLTHSLSLIYLSLPPLLSFINLDNFILNLHNFKHNFFILSKVYHTAQCPATKKNHCFFRQGLYIIHTAQTGADSASMKPGKQKRQSIKLPVTVFFPFLFNSHPF